MTETTRDLVITTGELYDILSRPGVTIEGLRLVVMHWPKDRARLCASRSSAPSDERSVSELPPELRARYENHDPGEWSHEYWTLDQAILDAIDEPRTNSFIGDLITIRDQFRAAPSEGPTPETCWLIERGQPEHHVPTVWWIGGLDWTETASEAAKFASRVAAEAEIRARSSYVGDPFGRAAEHVFLDEALKRVDVSGLFDDPPALPVPAQEARTAELIAWMAERSKMCDDALALNVLSDGTRVEAIALKAVYEDTIARLRSHSEIPEAPCPKCAQREARMFPIMDGPDVPWSLLEPHEKHAMKNHGQTLERLAERGGLAAVEALQILDAKPFGRVKLPVDYANRILAARVRSLRSADSSGSDRPAAPTVPETSNDR